LKLLDSLRERNVAFSIHNSSNISAV